MFCPNCGHENDEAGEFCTNCGNQLSIVDEELSAVIPKEILKKIKAGWIAAIVSGVATLFITVLSESMGTLNGLFDIWNLLDVVLIFILAFGIYKRSRVASTIMVVYFIISKILIIGERGQFSAILIGLIFLYFYFQAMIGTYQYHRIIKS